MSKYGVAYMVGLVGVALLPLSILAQSPIRTESLPPTPQAPEEKPAEEGTIRATLEEGTMRATLDAQVRPAQVPRAPMGSIELEATKVPKAQPLDSQNGTGWFVGLGVLLILSLLGNAFQLYRQGLYGKTIGNELVSIFNSIAWSLARCVNKTRELDGRLPGQKIADPVLLKEFREFSVDSEFILRALREQLVSVARNLRRKDKRWGEGQFGHTPEEIEKIRRVFADRPLEGSETA